MAFKVAENSLFAVLLRSPWWYSVLIGLAFIAFSLVIFNGQYVALGVFAAIPFFGIAAFSGHKQSLKPSRSRIIEVDQQARKMSAGQIADKIAQRYIEERYDSHPFDGKAAEQILTRGRHKIVLCSKRFKVGNTGIEPLKLLVSAGEKIEATGYLNVTLGEISAAARDYAEKNNIELIQADRLAAFFDGQAQIES